MNRRFSPATACLLFAAVFVLVLGGLATVTHAALGVERDERRAFARAESGNRERLALWQLDARVLPALAVENNRPFAHYYAFHTPLPLAVDNKGNISADPARLPSPLLSAEFPAWVTVYFQLDESAGWSSPQVLPPGAVENLGLEVPDQDPARAAALDFLKAKFPPERAYGLLAAGSDALGDSPMAFPVLVEPRVAAAEDLKKLERSSVGVPAQPSGLGRGGPGGMVAPAAPAGGFGGGFFGGTTAAQVPGGPPAPVPAPTAPAAQAAGAEPQAGNDAMTRNAAPQGRGMGGRANNEPDSFSQRKETVEKGMKDARGPDNAPAQPAARGGTAYPPASMDAAKAAEAPRNLEVPLPAAKAPPQLVAKPGEPAALAMKADPAPAKPLDTNNYYFKELDGSTVRRGQGNAARYQPPAVHVGPVRPHWLTAADGTQVLVLARPARLESKLVFQGVLLDWENLKAELKDAIAADFPGAGLKPSPAPAPVTERTMTALPVVLDPGPAPEPPEPGWTPLRLGLLAAWLAALLALAGVGFAGRALIDLSERRIRFVSAVTHELRTPLTSLRLYLDLLVSGMVREEEKQREYLTTLHGESDRLNRLIENVLDFARLEKRTVRAQRQPVAVDDLLADVRTTWADRAAADGKALEVISTLPPGRTINTDGRIAAQVLGNLVDNARKYTRAAEDNRIWVWAKPDRRGVLFEVEDRGCGVPAADRAGLFRPFRRGRDADTTAGGAGLGLALAKQWADLLGGSLEYRPAEGGVGACFRLTLPA